MASNNDGFSAGSSAETQPTKRERAVSKKWETPEEVELCKSWIDISDDGTMWNAQDSDSFWKRVTVRCHRGMRYPRDEEVRTHHQLNSKMRFMRKEIMKFNEFYEACLTMQMESGQSSYDCLTSAFQMFRDDSGGRAFKHVDSWNVVKDHAKWKAAYGH